MTKFTAGNRIFFLISINAWVSIETNGGGREMTIKEKIKINAYLRELYEGCRNIKYEGDRVFCTVDRMPNTNDHGRIFAGWDVDLLAMAEVD